MPFFFLSLRQENDGFLFGEREEKKISKVCKFEPNVKLFRISTQNYYHIPVMFTF